MLMQLLIIQVATFIVLIVLLRVLFSRQLNGAVKRLNLLHEENTILEEQLKKELDEAREKKDEELAKAKAEAEMIIRDAKTRAEKINLDTRDQAKEEAGRILDHSRAELKKEENELLGKYQKKAVELATKLLKATFTEKARDVLQRQLISELIEELKGLDKAQFTVKSDTVIIMTANHLTPGEKADLKKILSNKIGSAITLEESIDTDIIAGLIIQIGALTIDGSLRNKVEKVLPYIKDEK